MTYRDAGFFVLLKSLDFLTTENLEISHNINQEWIWKTCSQGNFNKSIAIKHF